MWCKQRALILKLGVMFFIICMAGCTSDVSANWQEKLKECAKQKEFACLLVDNGSSPEGQHIKEMLQEIAAKDKTKLGIIETDFSNEKESLEDFFKIKLTEAPLVLVVAPNGALTGMFDKKIDSDKLKQSFIPTQEADMVLFLQKGQAVFLCFYNQETDELKRVKSELGAIEQFFQGKASAQYLKTNDVSELAFVRRLPAFNHDAVTVFTVLPPGQLRSKLEGDQIIRANLLKAFQSCCPTGKDKSGKPCN